MSGIVPTSSAANTFIAGGNDIGHGAVDDTGFQAALEDAVAAQNNDRAAKPGSADAESRPAGPGALALSLDDQGKVRHKIHKSAQDFEAMFLGQMLEPMFAGLKSDAPFGGGHAEETWRSFMVQEMGKSVAKAGGVGVAKMIEDQLLDLAGLSGKPKPQIGPDGKMLPAATPDPKALPPEVKKALNPMNAIPDALTDPTRFAMPKMEIKA